MSEQVIVAFLDILGYGTIVKEHIDDVNLINGLEDILKVSIGFLKGIDLPAGNFNSLKKHINIKLISDTIIFTLNLSDISLYQNTISDSCIWLYFTSISMFCPFLIAKTGLALRGGISIGRHYENETNGNIFIFSEAYIKAYELQVKEKPRIVVNSDLIQFLENRSFNYTEKFFYKDIDNKICFNFYSFLENNDKAKVVLTDIKKGITLNILKNKTNPDIIDKLRYFVRYHNMQISTNKLAFQELSIDTAIFD